MDCYYVYQHFYTRAEFPDVDWFNDYALYQPVLYGPEHQSKLCADNAPHTKGIGSGIVLRWESVPQATRYILQWCKNSSFRGPTLRAIDVSTTQYQLKVAEDILHGDEVFWRVMAYNTFGGISSKSEPRSFKYECPAPQPGKSGGSGNSDNKSFCDEFNVIVELNGPKIVECRSKHTYAAPISFDCVDIDTNTIIVELVSVEWELDTWGVEAANVVLVPTIHAQKRLVVTESVGNHIFTLRVVATFRHIPTNTTFVCPAQRDIIVDCLADHHYYTGGYAYQAGSGGGPTLAYRTGFAYGGLYATFDTISSGTGTEAVVFSTQLPFNEVTLGADIVIKHKGRYKVSWNCDLEFATASGQTRIELHLNGALSAFQDVRNLDTAHINYHYPMSFETIRDLEVGDALSLKVAQVSGGVVISVHNMHFMVEGLG